MGGSTELPGQRGSPQERRRGAPGGEGRGAWFRPPEALGGGPGLLPSGSRQETQVPGGYMAGADQQAARGLRSTPRPAWRAKERPQWCSQQTGLLWRPVKGPRGAPKAPRPDPAAGIPAPAPSPSHAALRPQARRQARLSPPPGSPEGGRKSARGEDGAADEGPGALCSPSDMASLMLPSSLGQGFCHQSGFAALSVWFDVCFGA